MALQDEHMDHLARFIDMWFGDIDRGHLQVSTLTRGGPLRTRNYPLGNITGALPDLVAQAHKANERGDEVYVRTTPVRAVPEKGRGDMTWSLALPGVWHEVDVAEAGGHKQSFQVPPTWALAEEWIKNLPLEPSMIIRSGGGYHLYWCATEPLYMYDEDGQPTPGQQDATRIVNAWGAALQALAHERGWALDSGIAHNLACLLRLPGLYNNKREVPALVEIVEESGQRYDWSDIEEMAQDVLGASELYQAAEADGGKYTGLASSSSSPGGVGRNDKCKAFISAKLADGWPVPRVARAVVEYDRARHDIPLFTDRGETAYRTDNAHINALMFVSNIVVSIHNRARAEGREPDWGKSKPVGNTDQLAQMKTRQTVSFRSMFNDNSSFEEHYVEGFIPPRSFILMAGAPKSMKSMVAMHLGIALATGTRWLGFEIPKPRRVLYIQFELEDDILRQRTHLFGRGKTPAELVMLDNLIMSPRMDDSLDAHNIDQWLEWTSEQVLLHSLEGPPEVIIFDPLRNMLECDENDNAVMMGWLRSLMSRYIAKVNPQASCILVHHCRKVTKRDMQEDPFNAIRGASSIRGFYTSCMMIHRPSMESEDRKVWFDLRAGQAPDSKTIRLVEGDYVEVMDETPKAGATMREQWDEESRRVRDRILREINRRAAIFGDLYTKTTLCKALGDSSDLPSANTMSTLLKNYAIQGYVRFSDGAEFGLRRLNRKAHGYVVTESTALRVSNEFDDECWQPVSPTHAIDYSSGTLVELAPDEREAWHYEDGLYDPAEVAWKFTEDGRAIVDAFNTRGQRHKFKALRRNLADKSG